MRLLQRPRLGAHKGLRRCAGLTQLSIHVDLSWCQARCKMEERHGEIDSRKYLGCVAKSLGLHLLIDIRLESTFRLLSRAVRAKAELARKLRSVLATLSQLPSSFALSFDFVDIVLLSLTIVQVYLSMISHLSRAHSETNTLCGAPCCSFDVVRFRSAYH